VLQPWRRGALWLGEELVGEIGRATRDAFGEVSQEDV
jgi:hypothetical protein